MKMKKTPLLVLDGSVVSGANGDALKSQIDDLPSYCIASKSAGPEYTP